VPFRKEYLCAGNSTSRETLRGFSAPDHLGDGFQLQKDVQGKSLYCAHNYAPCNLSESEKKVGQGNLQEAKPGMVFTRNDRIYFVRLESTYDS